MIRAFLRATLFLGIGIHCPLVRVEAAGPRRLEPLGRGVVAILQEDGHVFVSWRMLGTDPDHIKFNVYTLSEPDPPHKLNETPIADATHFIHTEFVPTKIYTYAVEPIFEGCLEKISRGFTVQPPQPYLSIPLQTLPGHAPNDASVGDLDGDGEYEIVIKQEMRPRDNSQAGQTGETKLEAYSLAGKFLWRINLGKNIREGAHYTPFLVYDFDGDGRAEVACKTADGTVDGQGKILGDSAADHRNERGYILDGLEFLTIFDGLTGRELATAPYDPPRGRVADWGDAYGNRVDRFLAAVAYLDGERPSLVMCRGYYTRTVLAAWNYRDGKLSPVWTFDSDQGMKNYAGQGNHNLAVGDVDHDGRDEIIYGACAIDADGRGLYSTGLGHGDAIHLGDFDPSRPGLEVFDIHEKPKHPQGAEFRDARTGESLWSKPSPDVGRGLIMDIDPRYPGCESWAAGQGLQGLWNVQGEQISNNRPRSCNFAVWWDGDLLRELLDRNTISKWDWNTETTTTLLSAEGCVSNNSTKATPALCADILGDWREEVIWRTTDNKELRIYTSTIPTKHRLPTLMHDPQYRLSICWQNVGYNLPAQVGFFLGEGMTKAPKPKIRTDIIINTKANR